MICTPHPIFFPVIKTRRKRRAEHVARMGGEERLCRVSVETPEGRDHLGDPGGEDNVRMNLQEVDRAGSG
jgi:hypothetical protein